MHVVTHGLLAWLCGETLRTNRRGRIAVTLAGIIPDLDGLGAPVEILSGGAMPWFSEYHHRLCHNGITAFIAAGLAWLWCRDPRIAAMALFTAHLHLFCDVIGGRGPDGHSWPIPYFLPFHGVEWTWSGQWELNGWPNFVITGLALVAATVLTLRRSRSPLEVVNLTVDRHFTAMLHRWLRRSSAP